MNLHERIYDDKKTSAILKEKIQEAKAKKDSEEKQKVQQFQQQEKSKCPIKNY